MRSCYDNCATLRIAVIAFFIAVSGLLSPEPATAQTLLDMVKTARAAAANGDTDKALSIYLRAANAIESQPKNNANSAYLQNEISILHRLNGAHSNAIAAAGKAVSLGRAAKVPSEQLAIYQYNLALSHFDNADYGTAHRTFSQALESDQATENHALKINILRERGKTLQVLGDATGAIDDFTLALGSLEQTPETTRLRSELLRLLTATHLVAGSVGDARFLVDQLPAEETEAASQVLRARVLIAEGALGQARQLLEDVLGQSDDRLALASAHYNLAEIHFSRGDYPASARSNLKAQSLYTDLFGADHYALNQTTHRQAILLQESGDFASSLDLFTTVQSRTEALFGKSHPTWIATEIERSKTLVKLGQSESALVSLRNLTTRELTARSGLLARSALGLRYFETNQDAEAIRILEPVVADWRTGAYGFADAPPTMTALAELYARRQDWDRAAATVEDVIGLLSARGAVAIDRLSEARRIKAAIHLGRGELALAEDIIRQNLDTAAAQIANLALSSGYGVNYAPRQIRAQVEQAIQLYWSQSGRDTLRPLSDAMFFAMQIMHLNETSAAALGTYVASKGKFAPLLSRRQTIVDQLRVLQSRHLAMLRQGRSNSADDATSLLHRIEALETDLAALDRSLRQQAPEAISYLSPAPVSLADVQSGLGPSEALWLHVALDDASYVAHVTATRAQVFRMDISSSDLAKLVRKIRATLDFRNPAGLPAFDAETAHFLYNNLVHPALTAQPGIKTLYAIPDGAMQQISLAVLVMGRKDGALPENGQDNRALRFLGHEIAIAHLPSPQFLIAQARYSGVDSANGLVGFGDPLLEGDKSGTTRALSGTFDRLSGLAKPEILRSELQRLPLSRKELEAIRTVADNRSVRLFLGADANETQVRTTDYTDTDTLIFATHALVAGDFTDLSEPAIVLTPPTEAHAGDDGLLLASEIVELDLNARLVILSACNTGSSSGRPGATGLSGLARAFWVAGAERMLVSHWEISSRSAAAITPTFFLNLKNAPDISGAEALRRSMVRIFEASNEANFAHPAFWGAFSMIGRG